MPELGDIKKGYQLGYWSNRLFIYAACSICGKARYVLYYNGKPSVDKCVSCAQKARQARQHQEAISESARI
jgi:hypothetical protein